MEFSQTVNTGTVLWDKHNVVRQYGVTNRVRRYLESWFSRGWWMPETKVMEREIHPGMGMHISVVYVVAYNILNLATTYCSMESFHAESTNLSITNTMAKRIPLKTGTLTFRKPKGNATWAPPVLTQSHIG
jgi:hypothetical protein